MKKLKNYFMHFKNHDQSTETKWIFPLAIGLILSLFLLFITTLTSAHTHILPLYRSISASYSVFVEPISTLPPPPRLAYHISGSAGDGGSVKRVLLAMYHPHNRYVVHLDLESSPEERLDLFEFVKNHELFKRFENVKMITKANLVTYRGPTMVTNFLHGAAILLKEYGDWDWFINLSSSDYPLVTQDDLLHTFSYLPRDLNFIEHTSKLGWKEPNRAMPIMVDPGFYMNKKQSLIWATQKRSRPTAFKLFTGSAWVVLSRSFVNYLIWGWDNLPRTVLMYYSNFVSSSEGYFQTVICNAQEFMNTTVNSDLHFIAWKPGHQHPNYLRVADMKVMVDNNVPFARKFPRDDPVLDKIDSELLSRSPGMPVPGGWCIGSNENGTDPCSIIGNTTVLRPDNGSKRLETLISKLLSAEKFRPSQCV
ncbi:Beta-glucuronosyltransferase GlcAT14B [Trifolium repens]|nr:Beta-glucuronosyltransferase GlcAT14B [Trifolium repens]